jgi:hypothetical protein
MSVLLPLRWVQKRSDREAYLDRCKLPHHVRFDPINDHRKQLEDLRLQRSEIVTRVLFGSRGVYRGHIQSPSRKILVEGMQKIAEGALEIEPIARP